MAADRQIAFESNPVDKLVQEIRALEADHEIATRNDRAARSAVVTANHKLSQAAQAVMNLDKRIADKYRELERAVREEAEARVRA